MVPKHEFGIGDAGECFRAVLFRMVPKQTGKSTMSTLSFRAVLFRMVPKLKVRQLGLSMCFRAVLFRMVPKPFIWGRRGYSRF